MSDAILEKFSQCVGRKVQYDALALEQYAVTDQMIASATTARLEAIDLALIRWADGYKYEIKTLENLCRGASRAWQPGRLPSDMMSVATNQERTTHEYAY